MTSMIHYIHTLHQVKDSKNRKKNAKKEGENREKKRLLPTEKRKSQNPTNNYIFDKCIYLTSKIVLTRWDTHKKDGNLSGFKSIVGINVWLQTHK